MVQMDRLLDLEQGLVSRKIFSDPDIHRQELERVFHRCWLYLGHETMIPRPGDYVTTSMGEDQVIVWRDQAGRVGAFLNTCLHRGNKVCLYDSGRAASLTCSYHGWSYNSEGKLTGVPYLEEAYYGDLETGKWGLVSVPKVQSYGGLLFGCWDAGGPSLDDYLGELRWYFDKVLLAEDLGGLEVIPGCQRYVIIGNWKGFCDNFSGDHYHTSSTHGSATAVMGFGRAQSRGNPANDGAQGNYGYFETFLKPAHGLGGIYTDDSQYQRDLAQAQRMGGEVLEWVTERERRVQERLKDLPAKPSGWSHGNCFPNLNFVSAAGALQGRGFLLCQPKGPFESEIWQWALVERDAPGIVKDMAAAGASRSQAPAGLFGQDDCENFERITDMTRTPFAQKLPFNYSMGMRQEGNWPGQEQWHTEGLPGLVGPHFWETNQRRFYQYWAELMGIQA